MRNTSRTSHDHLRRVAVAGPGYAARCWGVHEGHSGLGPLLWLILCSGLRGLDPKPYTPNSAWVLERNPSCSNRGQNREPCISAPDLVVPVGVVRVLVNKLHRLALLNLPRSSQKSEFMRAIPGHCLKPVLGTQLLLVACDPCLVMRCKPTSLRRHHSWTLDTSKLWGRTRGAWLASGSHTHWVRMLRSGHEL